MSVTATVQLPDQPGSGETVTTALGGNGFVSPHSTTQVSISSAGDATGGFNRLYVRFDPRYVQLPDTVQVTVLGATADIPVEILLQQRKTFSLGIVGNVNNSVAISGLASRLVWTPPPVLMTAPGSNDETSWPNVRLTAPNVDGDTVGLLLTVFNFDRQARERVPMELLTRVLVRGTHAT